MSFLCVVMGVYKAKKRKIRLMNCGFGFQGNGGTGIYFELLLDIYDILYKLYCWICAFFQLLLVNFGV